jgi:fumarate hydratase class II
MNNEFRIEKDSMGEMKVPTNAYYGPQTARAIENFPISGLRFPRSMIRALGLIKQHAASANEKDLPLNIASPISRAAQEVVDGKWDDQFVVDIFQTGSGTSLNMNANEVIARRAEEILGDGQHIHPNDHVNRGQSSNDVIPSALHIAALEQVTRELLPALTLLESKLTEKKRAWFDVVKIGRTHLQDATPIRVGQEFSGFASQVQHGIRRLRNVERSLSELALGGTAVGTGINTEPDFARRVIEAIAAETSLPFREAENHFEAQAARDGAVEASGALRTVAISLIKIANDIRLLGSGPRLGLGELKLPPAQPGSSIMPGKVNPVMCEMLVQIGAQVIGNDAAIAFAGAGGHLQLNAMIPVIAKNLLESISLLSKAVNTFTTRCVDGLEVDEEKCRRNVEQSLALVTALVPTLGYDAAADLAKKAQATGQTIRAVAEADSGLDFKTVQSLLDPTKHLEPRKIDPAV